MSRLGIMASQISGHLVTNSYESIQTVEVGSGGQSSISFTSIPSTYKHLQIRGICLTSSPNNDIVTRFNSDSGSNYSFHVISGNGAGSISAYNSTSTTYATIGYTGDSSNPASFIADILDYSSTSKFKTTRSINGNDANGSTRYINFMSGNWRNASAITSITITHGASVNFNQYSSFALYGIKG